MKVCSTKGSKDGGFTQSCRKFQTDMENSRSKVEGFPMMLLMPAALGLEGIPS